MTLNVLLKCYRREFMYWFHSYQLKVFISWKEISNDQDDLIIMTYCLHHCFPNSFKWNALNFDKTDWFVVTCWDKFLFIKTLLWFPIKISDIPRRNRQEWYRCKLLGIDPMHTFRRSLEYSSGRVALRPICGRISECNAHRCRFCTIQNAD